MLGLALLSSLCLSAQVFVMAPLTIIDNNGNIQDRDRIIGWLNQLQSGNVDGLMFDVWWGIVEKQPRVYNWNGYRDLLGLLKERHLKAIPVMSFHKCGGNVGDACNIPIPSFILSSPIRPFYKDESGHIADEYISLGFDEVQIEGRTPIQMYSDFMKAFAQEFESYLKDTTIAEVEVGVGPCGELRYPSYPLSMWSYPGCGQFTAYDSGMTAMLQQDAAAAGRQDFAHHPYNTGGYNARPDGADFWRWNAGQSWNTDYGKWYVKWYASKLIAHGSKVYEAARNAFGPNVELSSKIAGIHWWYNTPCHCAEVTAGFMNFQDYDGYRDIMTEFKKYQIEVCFTCLEMCEDGGAGSNPPALVNQIANDAKWAGLKFEGENALECYDWNAFMRIKGWTQKGLSRYTHLRMGDALMNGNNWNTFKAFVNEMHNA